MVTTIQISNDLANRLKAMKMIDSESYENVIWDMIEDSRELSETTKKNIVISERQVAEGKTVSLEEIKKRMKMKKCTP